MPFSCFWGQVFRGGVTVKRLRKWFNGSLYTQDSFSSSDTFRGESYNVTLHQKATKACYGDVEKIYVNAEAFCMLFIALPTRLSWKCQMQILPVNICDTSVFAFRLKCDIFMRFALKRLNWIYLGLNVIGWIKWEAAAAAGQDMTSPLWPVIGLDRLESVREQKTHLYSNAWFSKKSIWIAKTIEKTKKQTY